MLNFLKHVGLVIAGAACVGVGVLVPPAAPFLGAVGAKLLLAGGGSLALAAASPEVIAAGVALVRRRRSSGQRPGADQ